MTMTISDAAELKRAVKEKFRVELHLHDTCGGQYFTLDVPPTDALLRYIDKFLAGKRKRAAFAEDYLSFTVEERF